MKYPEWAPERLVNSLEANQRLAGHISDRELANILMQNINFSGCSDQQIQKYRARQYQAFEAFPQNERIELLKKLLIYRNGLVSKEE